MHVRQHIAKQKITNHASVSLSTGLGNVLVTISDKRLPQCSATVVTGHTSYVISATDYSAFGAPLPGRTFAGEGYRFGFNGMERDDEALGAGNSYSTEYRQYDPRLARWMSIDPMFAYFPWQSPYVAFDNNPIYFKDPKGAASEGEPKITFAPDAKKDVVSDHAMTVIKDVVEAAGLDEAKITSTYRSPERQMEVMYVNLTQKGGVSSQRDLYGKKGEAVIDAFEAASENGGSKDEIIAAMTKKALDVGFLSNHFKENYASYNIVDISYKNLSSSEYKALKEAAQADPRIKVVLGKEEGDKALHLEIPVLGTTSASTIDARTYVNNATGSFVPTKQDNLVTPAPLSPIKVKPPTN